MLTLYHTTNRTATTNGLISLAYAAGLGKYGYGNGIAVAERISGTVLLYSVLTTYLIPKYFLTFVDLVQDGNCTLSASLKLFDVR